MLVGAFACMLLWFIAGVTVGILTRPNGMSLIEALQILRRSIGPTPDFIAAYSMAALIGAGIGAAVAFFDSRRRKRSD